MRYLVTKLLFSVKKIKFAFLFPFFPSFKKLYVYIFFPFFQPVIMNVGGKEKRLCYGSLGRGGLGWLGAGRLRWAVVRGWGRRGGRGRGRHTGVGGGEEGTEAADHVGLAWLANTGFLSSDNMLDSYSLNAPQHACSRPRQHGAVPKAGPVTGQGLLASCGLGDTC